MAKNSKIKLTLVMLFGAACCVPALYACNTVNAETLDLPPGTVSQTGYRSEIYIKAEKTEDGGFLLELVLEDESPGIGDIAAKSLIETMNEHQSFNVDIVTSATETSNAVIEGAKKAVSEQQLDPNNFNEEVIYSLPEDIQAIQYDVAIVGAGAAGLTAAIEASSRGAEVILIEKMSQPGGSSARSNGLIMGSQTSYQRSNLVEDTNISFSTELSNIAGGNVNSSYLVRLAENSADNLFFLSEVGVPISPTVEVAEGSSVARNHVISNSTETGGGLMMQPLIRTATNLGVTIVTDVNITEISSDVTGKATGVRGVYKDGSSVAVRAHSVILATGGYDRNPELVDELVGNVDVQETYSGLSNVGDGIDLARDLYADVALNGNGLMSRLYDNNFETNDINGLIVTPSGERFSDESQSSFVIANELSRKGYDTAYLIISGDNVTSAIKDGVDEGTVYFGKTIDDLAQVLNMPNLADEFESYNETCQRGSDVVFGKDAMFLNEIENKNIYAIPYETITFGSIGGLQTNLSGEVVGLYSTIEGLFAAGEVANGNYFYEAFPGFGASLTQVVESGRVAGIGAFEHSEYAKALPEELEERERVREQNELEEKEAERLRQEAIDAATSNSNESAIEEALRITREFFGM